VNATLGCWANEKFGGGPEKDEMVPEEEVSDINESGVPGLYEFR
jgi:hypothetical protein